MPEKIKIRKDANGQVDLKCPHGTDNYVGSFACMWCIHCAGILRDKAVVLCDYEGDDDEA